MKNRRARHRSAPRLLNFIVASIVLFFSTLSFGNDGHRLLLLFGSFEGCVACCCLPLLLFLFVLGFGCRLALLFWFFWLALLLLLYISHRIQLGRFFDNNRPGRFSWQFSSNLVIDPVIDPVETCSTYVFGMYEITYLHQIETCIQWDFYRQFCRLLRKTKILFCRLYIGIKIDPVDT